MMRRERVRKCVVLFACAAGALGVVTGCQRVLFPENTPRTQFETHDRLRNRSTPLIEVDEFGRPEPALRARLSQSS